MLDGREGRATQLRFEEARSVDIQLGISASRSKPETMADPSVHAANEFCANRLVASPQFEPRRGREEEEEEEEESALTAFWSPAVPQSHPHIGDKWEHKRKRVFRHSGEGPRTHYATGKERGGGDYDGGGDVHFTSHSFLLRQ